MTNFTNFTPILFLVFNRPETTAKVFEAIRKARPPQLFVAADGPRLNRAEEVERCVEVRKIATAVDWPCEVKTLFRESNLGCRVAVSSAIDWFFENVEEGIILEDDCLPHSDFFRFSQELLAHYRDDERVMHIGGSNFLLDQKRESASYYFSGYAHIWGWASWRRAWKYYDVELEKLDKEVLKENLHSPRAVKRWLEILTKVKSHAPGFDTWDFQWNYALWVNNGLSVVPRSNLISNIGFDSGTHNLENLSLYSALAVNSMDDKIIHANTFGIDVVADKFIYKQFYAQSFFSRLKNKLRRWLK